MSRRAARFTQADITRAIKAAAQAGASMAVEIAPDGTIRLIPAEPRAQAPQVAPPVAKREALRLC